MKKKGVSAAIKALKLDCEDKVFMAKQYRKFAANEANKSKRKMFLQDAINSINEAQDIRRAIKFLKKY